MGIKDNNTGENVPLLESVAQASLIGKQKAEKTSIDNKALNLHTNESPSISKDMKDNEDCESAAGVKNVPLTKIFRYATVLDKIILFFGIIFAIIRGAMFPILAIVFGKMTNIFLHQAIYGFAPSHNEIFKGENNLTGIGIGILSPTSKFSWNSTNSTVKLLTKEEFGHIMAKFSLFYVYIGLLAFIASFIQCVCWEWSSERQVYRLRQEFFLQVLRQEISWFESHNSGDLAIKLSDDLDRIREGIGHRFSMIIQHFFSFLSGIIVGFSTSWQLTLVILALTPLLAIKTAAIGKYIELQTVQEQKKYGKAGSLAVEVISAIQTVAAFGREKYEIKRYQNILMDGLKTGIKKYHLVSFGTGFAHFILYVSYAITFWIASGLYWSGNISAGSVYTCFFSVLMGANSLGSIMPYFTTLGIARGSAAIIFEIIDSQPQIDPYSSKGFVLCGKTVGRIGFRNVTFSYSSRETIPVLKDFNLLIEPGKTIAIVGKSGSGKSTIINLIQRLYDPDNGKIFLDGKELKEYNVKSLRSQIGVVNQEPVLFAASVFDNISYGNSYASSAEIVKAAKLANAYNFIIRLPDGFSTILGERGTQLSGGQKQRIAIARALVRDPSILLLDEATSSLDSKAESIIQDSLDKARKNRTTIIVAHRLSTIKNADMIHVLKNGVIIESGNHTELIAKQGCYYEMIMAQKSYEALEEISMPGVSVSGMESAAEESVKEDREFIKQREDVKELKVDGSSDKVKKALANEVKELKAEYPGVMKILSVNKPEWWILQIGCIACIFTGMLQPSFTFIYSEIFKTFEATNLMDFYAHSILCCVLFMILAIVGLIAYWVAVFFIGKSGEYLKMRLRLESFSSILRMQISWFDDERNSAGRLSTRLARDAPLVKAAAGDRFGTLIACLSTTIISLCLAFYFGRQLAIVIIFAFPILMFSAYVQVRVQAKGQLRDLESLETAGRIATESIQNIRTVQSLGQEILFFNKYSYTIRNVLQEAHKQALYYGFAFALSGVILFFMYAVAWRYGAHLVEEGVLEPVNVFRTFFVIAFCAITVGYSVSFVPDYQKANLASSLVFNLIEQTSTIDPFSQRGLTPRLKGEIKYSDVHFAYPNRPSYKVLQGLSFVVKPGETLALVGPSGSGKSTVVSLLERFYEVNSGKILIDGNDIRDINISHLRKFIGLVKQEPCLFDCSIRENIAYGYWENEANNEPVPVPDDLIINAAKQANIHDFIIRLPKGYETTVGEAGSQLSGGQKQRIAIARTLIRNPLILLLDEATSSLDSESEQIVQQALDRARAGRTCIIIAHRLSTIQNANIVAVISKGKIAEFGSPEELYARKGLFYQLAKKQHIQFPGRFEIYE